MKVKFAIALVLISLLIPYSFCYGKSKAFGEKKLFYFDGKIKDKKPYGYGTLELFNPRDRTSHHRDYFGNSVTKPAKVFQKIVGIFDHENISNASLFVDDKLIFEGDLKLVLKEESKGWTSTLYLQKGVLSVKNDKIEITRPYELKFISDYDHDALTHYSPDYCIFDGWVATRNTPDCFKYINLPSTATLYTKMRKILAGLRIKEEGYADWKYRDFFGNEKNFEFRNNRISFENGDYIDFHNSCYRKTLDSCIVSYEDRQNGCDLRDEIEAYIYKHYKMNRDMYTSFVYTYNEKHWEYAPDTKEYFGKVFTVKYNNGDTFIGCINNSHYFDDCCSIATTPTRTDYWFGKLTKKDGTVTYYVYGQTTDECIPKAMEYYNAKQARFQKEKAAKEQAQQKAYLAACNKYGKKYVDAAKNQQLLVGMHEDLLLEFFDPAYTIIMDGRYWSLKLFNTSISSNTYKFENTDDDVIWVTVSNSTKKITSITRHDW